MTEIRHCFMAFSCHPSMMVSSNEINKLGRWRRKEITDFWRPRIMIEARNRDIPRLDMVDLLFAFRFPNELHRDTHNLTPVVKAAIDGLVDAGVMKGDDDRYVRRVTYERSRPNGPHEMSLLIREVFDGPYPSGTQRDPQAPR